MVERTISVISSTDAPSTTLVISNRENARRVEESITKRHAPVRERSESHEWQTDHWSTRPLYILAAVVATRSHRFVTLTPELGILIICQQEYLLLQVSFRRGFF
jgi:hypothetical protein